MNLSELTGKTICFGDNIDTDAILPARYLGVSTQEELGMHFMEDLCPELRSEIEPGSILIAGTNFGCGSSREHAPVAIRGAGISCVVAESFSRIFFRNAINIGLPVIELKGASKIAPGRTVCVDCEQGTVTDVEMNEVYQGKSLSGSIKDIIAGGGLIAYMLDNE